MKHSRTKEGDLLLFVYGSLMRGYSNHRLLARAEFLHADHIISPGPMLSLGGIPGLLPGPTPTRIAGELYRVDSLTLAACDRLEGHPNFYRRTLVQLDTGPALKVYTYILAERPSYGEVVASGCWRAHTKARALCVS